MRDSRAKRRKPSSSLAQTKADREKLEITKAIEAGTLLPVDRTKIVSRSAIPKIPDYYRDTWFTCKECGERELWTAQKQKIWYETQGGEIEQIAVKCHACRKKERTRRAAVRKVHLDGLVKKNI